MPGDQVTREVGQVGWTRNMSHVKNTCLAYHDRQVRRRLVQLEGRLASVDSDVGRQGDRMEGLQGTVTVRSYAKSTTHYP